MALIAIMQCILCSFQILARPKRYLILLDLENKVNSHFIIERKIDEAIIRLLLQGKVLRLLTSLIWP